MTGTTTSKTIRKMTYLAMLTAIVVVLQMAGASIRFGMFSVSLVLMPIVLGAAIGGPVFGAWLGAVFGIVVIASGDAAAFLAVNPIGTVITVMVKGIGAGLVAGLVYNMAAEPSLNKKRNIGATVCAAVSCPIVNTGVFLLGCLAFFMPTISEWAATFGYESAGAYMILGLAGGNFLLELVLNMVLVPAIVSLLNLVPSFRRR